MRLAERFIVTRERLQMEGIGENRAGFKAMQKSYLSYRQAQLAYFDEGSGPAILFLPGFLEHSGMWSNLWPQFAESWRKISLDLPGHGQSGNLGYIHTMDEMAATAKALVDHLGLGKVLLCGHSMGGYVALAFLERYPSLVRGIILLNSSAFPDSELRKANRQRAIKLVTQDPAAYVRQAITDRVSQQLKNKSEFDILFTDLIVSNI